MVSATDRPALLSEGTLAYFLIRLFLAIRFLHAFAGKLMGESGEPDLANLTAFAGALAEGFGDKLPMLLLTPYAHALPWVELLLGLMLLLGIRMRITLFLTGLTYLSLLFGQLLVKQYGVVADITLHLAFVVAALLLVRHNRLELLPDPKD